MRRFARVHGVWIAAVAAMLAALAVPAAPALAVPSTQYRGCDGYGAPSDAGDGMTEYADILGIFNPPGYGTTARSDTYSGAPGVAACDQALTDVPPAHWMRTVSLLRARAIHHLEAGETQPALADLDLAQAAIKDPAEPYFARSLGWGLEIVRAYATKKAGDRAKAETLAMAALAERPYTRQTLSAAFLAAEPGASEADEDTILHGIARLVPEERTRLFAKALRRGQFADAVALYPLLSPPYDPGIDSASAMVRNVQDLRNTQKADIFRAYTAGEYAYALAVLGRDDLARVTIAGARDTLTQATAPPPPAFDPNDDTEVRTQALTATMRAKTLAAASPLIDQWSTLVEDRLAVNAGKAAEVFKSFQATPLPGTWAATELMEAVAAKMPRGRKPLVINAITQPTAADSDPTNALFKILPEPESPGRVPKYEEATKPFFAMTGSQADRDTEGWRVREADGVTTVGFRGVKSTNSIVEEMALLRVAELAKEKGKTGFIVTARHDTKFAINTTYYGQTLRTDPDGYQTEFDVLFVDLAALPPQYASESWLAFNADEVYAALAPMYLPKTDGNKKD
ncbi:MAG: hypothetical protein ACREHE_06295 [Rhizomicrobium sp.]